jgi:uncharacterized membrane protein
MSYWKLLAIVVPVCIAIDLIWIALVMKNFYSQELGDLARRDGLSLAPRWGAALFVYVLLPVGIVTFVRPRWEPTARCWRRSGWGRCSAWSCTASTTSRTWRFSINGRCA